MQWSGWEKHYQFFLPLPHHICFLPVVILKWELQNLQREVKEKADHLTKGQKYKRSSEISLIWPVLWQIFQALAMQIGCSGNMRNKERGWQFVMIRSRRTGTLSSHLEVSSHQQVLNQTSEQRTCKNQLEEGTHRWWRGKLRNSACLKLRKAHKGLPAGPSQGRRCRESSVQRGWQCLWLLEEQVYPTAVLCFPEVKDNITIIKDTDVGHSRLINVLGVCTNDINFT